MTGERKFTIAIVLFAVAIGWGFWNESRLSAANTSVALAACLSTRAALLENAVQWDDRAKSSAQFVEVYRRRKDADLAALEQGVRDGAVSTAATDRRNAALLDCTPPDLGTVKAVPTGVRTKAP
jgi:predicted negative regulator of RcsB-dependent stress response